MNEVTNMGRHVKVPLENGRIVNKEQVGTDGNTPYSPSDVKTEVCQRLFGQDMPPEYEAQGSENSQG